MLRAIPGSREPSSQRPSSARRPPLASASLQPSADDSWQCYICLENCPIPFPDDRPGTDPLVRGLCQCTTLAMHISCLETMVNSTNVAVRPLDARLSCPICKAPYQVNHTVEVPPPPPPRQPADIWEIIAWHLTEDEDRREVLASQLLQGTIIAIGLIAMTAIVVVYALFDSSRHKDSKDEDYIQSNFAVGLAIVIFFMCMLCFLSSSRSHQRHAGMRDRMRAMRGVGEPAAAAAPWQQAPQPTNPPQVHRPSSRLSLEIQNRDSLIRYPPTSHTDGPAHPANEQPAAAAVESERPGPGALARL